jgi:putative ABC transport system permease protein
MFSSDFKAALRSIFRRKVVSAISILGLGIGLGCIIILIALTVHERSFDKFVPDYNRVNRIIFGTSAQINYPLAEEMKKDFPEVTDFFRFYQAPSLQIKAPGGEMLREGNFCFADSSIYRIIGIKFIAGKCASTTSEVAISEETAITYFGNLSPIGSVFPVRFNDGFADLMISGVYKTLPPNSTLQPSFLADIKLSVRMFAQYQKYLGAYGRQGMPVLDWSESEFLSYVVLSPNADPVELAGKMKKYKEFIVNENKDKLEFRLQPLRDVYLGSEGIFGSFMLRQGNPEELVYYEIIALLILIISVANYILLTRAGVLERLAELGTRKTYGATGKEIRRLIILESNVVVLLSLLPAGLGIEYGIQFVNETLNKTLTSQVFLDPILLVIIAIVVVFTGTLAGWLIGLYYSKIPALNLITGTITGLGNRGRWNYSFLVLPFTIYMILVCGVITVNKQIKYSMTDYKGLDPTNILVTSLSSDNLRKSFNTLCDEIERIPGVKGTAGGSFIPPFGNFLPISLATPEGEKIRFDGLIMGEGMTELLGMQIIDGESFGPYKQGTTEILINESTAKENKVKAGDKLLVFTVKGVLKDFHAHSMHSLIQPMVILQQNPERMGLITIKTDGKNDQETIKRIKELFAQISPEEIVDIRHLTDRFDAFYGRERNQAKIIGAFAILATVLSVMGLFGISMISIQKRRKEIGLRKVNGASIWEVLLMVNTDFLKWVIAAVVVSVPVSVYLLRHWLVGFAYKTDLSIWIFLVAGLSGLVVAILTVSYQSLKSATRNPVKVLRYE